MLNLIFAFLLVCLGIFLMIKGSDFFVDGSSSIAKNLKIPVIIIGLTIVSFGTSAPELTVSLVSALNNNTTLSLNNILGSNIFNTLFILGFCTFIRPLKIASNTVWKEIPFSVLAILMLVFLGLNNSSVLNRNLLDNFVISNLGYSFGLVSLCTLLIYIYYLIETTRQNQADEKLNTQNTQNTQNKLDKAIKQIVEKKGYFSIFYLISVGLLGLVIGGNLTVNYAVFLAQSFQINEKIVGVTIISVGTSLPDLITSVQATIKKEYDLAIGNVVGSNIINIMLVLGITSLINPLKFSSIHLIDSVFLAITTFILFGLMFIFKKYSLGKIEGFVLLSLYAGYICYLINFI